jgi:ribosome-binding factor A
MEESKRQKQIGQLIMEELSDIFQREGFNVVEGGMVSISKVMVTPDLLQARVYLSLFQIKDPEKLLHTIKERAWDFRKQLGQRVRNQLRNVPELTYYNDDTLDYVFKMEELFRQINDEREKNNADKKDVDE